MTISEKAARDAASGAPAPALLSSIAPAADHVYTEAGGYLVGGAFNGYRAYGWANMGALAGGPADAMKDHAAGYTELACKSVSSQFRPANSGGYPGSGVQEGVFIAYPKKLIGDFSIDLKLSRGHPGSYNYFNNALGIVAKRQSTATVAQDTRIHMGVGSDSSAYLTPRLRMQLGATLVSATSAGNVATLMVPTWIRMAREADLIRAFWKAADEDPWIELDAPGLGFDVAGSVCEVGFGWGAHNENQAWRIYKATVTGVEAA